MYKVAQEPEQHSHGYFVSSFNKILKKNSLQLSANHQMEYVLLHFVREEQLYFYLGKG